MTLNDLTISPSTVNFDGLLSDWDWVLNEPSKPVLLTVFGDAFIQGDSGRVYLIDACNGTLIDIAKNGHDFSRLLADTQFVKQYFYPDLFAEYKENGLSLTDGSCYSYKRALVLGGSDELSNVEVSDFSVHFSLMGQIHRQCKDLPEGAEITRLELEDCEGSD